MSRVKLKSMLSIMLFSVCSLSVLNAHPNKELFSELNLSESQRKNLLSIRADRKDGFLKIKAQREELKSLMASGNINAAADMAANLASQKVYNRAQKLNELKSILSEEQIFLLKEGRHKGKMRKPTKFFKELRNLELTKQQRNELKTIRSQLMTGMQAAGVNRKEVRELINSNRLDEAADLAAESARNFVYKRSQLIQQIKVILTDEQLQQLKELRVNLKG